MHRKSFILKLISCAVVLSLAYTEVVYAVEPFCLTSSSAFTKKEFCSAINLFSLISNLLSKKNPEYDDLILIRSLLADHLNIPNPNSLILVYNKKQRELFAYTGARFLHIYKLKKTKLGGADVKEEDFGRIKVASYKFNKLLEKTVREIKDTFILGPEQALKIPVLEGLRSPLYLQARFWFGLLVLFASSPVFLFIYCIYSINDKIQKKRLKEEEFQHWIEKRRYGLLSFGIPILKMLPFLRTELKHIFKDKVQVFAEPLNFSEKKIDKETIIKIIHERDRVLLDDSDFKKIKNMLADIIGDNEARNLINDTNVYLVSPGRDVNNPFLFYEESRKSYVYTFVTEEIPQRQGVIRRIMRSLIRKVVSRLKIKRSKNVIYISRVFYEQLSRNKSLLIMLLAEKIIELVDMSLGKKDEIFARINALNDTGITLDEAKTIIKNAYFLRERERSPPSWTKGTVREWMRKKILDFINWSKKYDGWFQFLKLMMSEFFTITAHWIRTPFLYPIRRNLHCGMPTPDNPLPEYGSYLWALRSGFSDSAARIIGEADACTDNVTTGWAPKIGSQSRHFNMYLYNKYWKTLRGIISNDLLQLESFFSGPDSDRLVRESYISIPQFQVKKIILLPPCENWSEFNYPDTRLDWAQYELERAVHFYRMGEKRKALECLGRGLHSLQDLTAHMDFDTGPFGTRIHPAEYDDPEYDTDETGGLVLSRKRIRVKDTERLTKLYLELAKWQFLKIDNRQERKYLQELISGASCNPVEPFERSLQREVSV